MRNILYCRRTFIAILSISVLAAMAFVNGTDTSMAIASIAAAIGAANAFEGSKRKASVINE